MICEFCEVMCARAEVQLESRRQNMLQYPNIEVYACPKCGGTEWATTDRFIERPRPPPEPWSAWLIVAMATSAVAIFAALYLLG